MVPFNKWPAFIFLFFLTWIFTFPEITLSAEPKAIDPSYKLIRLVKDTPLPGCNGATIGPDGALYVVHLGTGHVSRIDLKTGKAGIFVPPYAGMSVTDDISSDDQGNLYITGTTSIVGEVYRIDKKGMKTVIGKGFLAPNGIQYNRRTKRLFMTECFWGNRVFELDPAGINKPKLLVKENIIAVPEGFDFDPDTHDLIIPDMGTGRILRVNPDSGNIDTIAETNMAPVALKIGPDKMAYIPMLGGTVFRISLDGQKKENLAQLPPGLDNLAITPEGRLYVTSYWNATIYEVKTDGTGKFDALFSTGPNQITGITFQNGKILLSDSIMVRSLEKGQYVPTRINTSAAAGIPMPLGLANGPGDQVFWPDFINNVVALGNPVNGEFKTVAGGLNRPIAVLMNPDQAKIMIAEYGAGQVTEVILSDGTKKVLSKGLDGPLSLAIISNMLYVSEGKLGRISKIDLSSGKTEVFISGVVGKVSALAGDGAGRLLALDSAGGRLFRIDPKNQSISLIAENLPVAYFLIGSYPALEFPHPMTVSPEGDIYLPTVDRGLIVLEKK
ncbi:MAG: hypothetical protein AB1585_03790 [Thermodesulfobacteriota bacterium]